MAAEGAADAGAGARDPVHVLVVEDDRPVRVYLETLLRGRGWRVTAAEDGLAALEALAVPAQSIDLVLTDIVMPGLDGISLALTVLRDHPRLKLVLMTGYGPERISASELDGLGHRILAKPFTPAELMTVLGAVLEARGSPAPERPPADQGQRM